MKTDTLLQVSDRMIESVFKELPFFTLRRQAHFAERVYRVTGNEKYAPILKNYLVSIYYSLYRFKDILGDTEKERSYGLDKIMWLRSRSSQLKEERWKYYETNPEMKLYQEIIFILYKFHEYPTSKLHETTLVQNFLRDLRKIDWKKKLIDPTLMKFDPVQTINTVWWIYDLGIVDLRNEIVKLFLSSYEKETLSSEFTKHNYYYGLTHIILCESNYYRNYATSELAIRVFNTLNLHEEDILSSGNYDLLCEVGIIYKLTQQPHSAIQKYQSKVLDGIDPLTHLLPIAKEKEAHFEHAHSLAFVLLYPWTKLNSTISIQINESEL